MLKRVILFALCAVLTFSLAISAQPKKAAAKGAAEWKAEMSMVDAINAALTAVSEKYPAAEAFKADLKYGKKGGKYTVQVKIEDTKCVKVDVEFDGKIKINDKKGEFFPVSKAAVKDQSALPQKAPKRAKKKAAADDDEDM